MVILDMSVSLLVGVWVTRGRPWHAARRPQAPNGTGCTGADRRRLGHTLCGRRAATGCAADAPATRARRAAAAPARG